jgi:hypothetical protein
MLPRVRFDEASCRAYPHIDGSGRGNYDPAAQHEDPTNVVQWPGVFVSHLIP